MQHPKMHAYNLVKRYAKLYNPRYDEQAAIDTNKASVEQFKHCYD
jgi:hypothetical protein